MHPALTGSLTTWTARQPSSPAAARAGMANTAWWKQRYMSFFWCTHLSLYSQLSKWHNSGIFLMLLASSKCWKPQVFLFLRIKDNKTNLQWLRSKESKKNIKLKSEKSVTLKTSSVSWEPGTRFFNSKWQCWEGDTAKRLPNSDTQNMCSAYQDWSQWKKTGTVSNTTAPSWGIYLCNIWIPNLFSTQEKLGGEALSLAGLFCLFAAGSAEPCSSSESRFIWTKVEAPIVQRGPVGRR